MCYGGITSGGADYTLKTTAVPELFGQVVQALAPLGMCDLIGAAPLGTESSLDAKDILIPGKTVRGIVEGDSVPAVFIPRLIELYEGGHFPFNHLIEFYDLEGINQAAEDSEEGTAIKAVLRMQ